MKKPKAAGNSPGETHTMKDLVDTIVHSSVTSRTILWRLCMETTFNFELYSSVEMSKKDGKYRKEIMNHKTSNCLTMRNKANYDEAVELSAGVDGKQRRK